MVSGTTPTTIGTTTPLVSSDSWYWPDNVVLSADGTVAYVMDGGYREGFVVTLPPYEYGFIYQCALTASPVQCTPVYSNDTLFLRGGLALTADQSTLVFGATYFIEQLLVNPSAVTTPILQPGSGSSLLQPSQLIQPFANAVQSDVILSLWLNTASPYCTSPRTGRGVSSATAA